MPVVYLLFGEPVDNACFYLLFGEPVDNACFYLLFGEPVDNACCLLNQHSKVDLYLLKSQTVFTIGRLYFMLSE